MSSIFKKTVDEIRRQEIEGIDFDKILEQGLKKCNLNESLELLLYDVSEALKENQVLLVEAGQGRETAYLIPLLLAYQNTTYLKKFMIASPSPKSRAAIATKMKELSQLLGIDIPIHMLENEKNYFCLKRLNGYNKKRKEPIENCHQKALRREEWRKIQVKNCTLPNCSFAKRCKYAIDYRGIISEGCSIISHTTLIGNKRHSQVTNLQDGCGIVIIDSAEEFAHNVRDIYQQQMDFDYIHDCFDRAQRLLNRKEYSYITNTDFIELKAFFEELAECKRGKVWKVPSSLQQKGKDLSNVARKALIHLTRPGTIKHYSREIEQFCERLYILESFFEDISTSEMCPYTLLEMKRSKDTPMFRKMQILYHPNKVDIIISNRLKNEDCSIVFTGKTIAGDDCEYTRLCEECGIERFGKETVKEYVLH